MARTFIYFDEDTGNISISAYSLFDELYENNHIELVELRAGKVNKHESVINIVRNVLVQCGIDVVIEQ